MALQWESYTDKTPSSIDNRIFLHCLLGEISMNLGGVLMPILWSLAAPEVVIWTVSGDGGDGILPTLEHTPLRTDTTGLKLLPFIVTGLKLLPFIVHLSFFKYLLSPFSILCVLCLNFQGKHGVNGKSMHNLDGRGNKNQIPPEYNNHVHWNISNNHSVRVSSRVFVIICHVWIKLNGYWIKSHIAGWLWICLWYLIARRELSHRYLQW